MVNKKLLLQKMKETSETGLLREDEVVEKGEKGKKNEKCCQGESLGTVRAKRNDA